MSVARVLVLAGLDPSGRAGLLADGEAIRAQGAVPVLCATAVAAQSHSRLVLLELVSPKALAAQVEAALEDGPIAAIKVGMIGTPALLHALLESLQELPGIPLVADPVLRTSRGGVLFEGEPREWLPLLSRADLVTPNLEEAERLTGSPCRERAQMEAAARSLRARGSRAVLLKGGHLAGDPADVLVRKGSAEWFEGSRILHARRGTGCRLASAIAAQLALGQPLTQAMRISREWLTGWLRAG